MIRPNSKTFMNTLSLLRNSASVPNAAVDWFHLVTCCWCSRVRRDSVPFRGLLELELRRFGRSGLGVFDREVRRELDLSSVLPRGVLEWLRDADLLERSVPSARVGRERPSSLRGSGVRVRLPDDDDDDDAEDTDEAGEMVAIPAPTRPAGRRTSVSAGVMNLERAKAHVAPVFDKSDEEKARILKCISSNPLFSECDNAALETLTAAFEKCSFPPGQVIIRQGDLVAEHFFLLDSGTASALIGEQEVKTYNDGDSFGELALLYNQPRAATVKATSDAALWRLDQNTFKSIIVANVLEKRAKYIEFLKRCQLMQALSELEIMTLADSLEPRTFSKGQEIIVQGEVGNDFYVIEDGEVQCVKDGEPVLKLSSGDYFGELALLYNQARQASVVVESDGASVLVIDRKTFQRLMGPLGAILKRNPLHAQYIELASE
mmetsp:Transcript_11461/g.29029  ORF Transcript_11461/g.29029 Transcript_11461/m.29029 type:complete len:433 (+) Transcript_11461:491-1789(+)